MGTYGTRKTMVLSNPKSEPVPCALFRRTTVMHLKGKYRFHLLSKKPIPSGLSSLERRSCSPIILYDSTKSLI